MAILGTLGHICLRDLESLRDLKDSYFLFLAPDKSPMQAIPAMSSTNETVPPCSRTYPPFPRKINANLVFAHPD